MPRSPSYLVLVLFASSACALAACGGDVTPVSPPEGGATVSASSAPPVTVFFQAHQDDWELFMGDYAYRSVAAGGKTVFVYTTAGDAGREAWYWQAREEGAMNAVRAIAPASSWSCESTVVGGHSVRRCTYGNTVSYFMRLPDGSLNAGLGFPSTGFQSMTNLRVEGKVLTAVDSSSSFTTWADFRAMLGKIVDAESKGARTVYINAPDPNSVENPKDNPDHWETGRAVMELTGSQKRWRARWFKDYATRFLPRNLSPADYEHKMASFGAYDETVDRRGGGSPYHHPGPEGNNYEEWLWHSYSRTKRR